jgi:hypothetical protein
MGSINMCLGIIHQGKDGLGQEQIRGKKKKQAILLYFL